MEQGSQSTTRSWFAAGPSAKKKRSNSRRRPHSDSKAIILPTHYGQQEDSNLYCSNDGYGAGPTPLPDKKPKKLKLKLGGVTRTLHTKSTVDIASGGGLLSVDSGDAGAAYGVHTKQPYTSSLERKYKYDVGHKSKRVAKKCAIDEGSHDEDDEEIRYLKKLKASKASGYVDRRDDGSRKSKDELRSKQDFGDPAVASSQDMTMTTRKRALECPDSGGLVEFPNGLPDPPSKKQKLSGVEQQLKKAEAAQRRRIQAERAAKEAEAEAIRKILGQDSNKKKELKKEELEQEKNDEATTLGPNTIRLIMGPNGTVITFSEDLGLPKIFDSLPCRYPPPREKCVGPNCTNKYKYRDSKSNLPLCSLNCYKAVQ